MGILNKYYTKSKKWRIYTLCLRKKFSQLAPFLKYKCKSGQERREVVN